MKRLAPCPIPECFFKGGELEFREGNKKENLSEFNRIDYDDSNEKLIYSSVISVSPILLLILFHL